MSETTKIILKLQVDYDLNGVSVDAIKAHLEESIRHAIAEGALSGCLVAEVDNYTLSIVEV